MYVLTWCWRSREVVVKELTHLHHEKRVDVTDASGGVSFVDAGRGADRHAHVTSRRQRFRGEQ